MNVWKPPVSSWISRIVMSCCRRSSIVSTWPYMMEAFVRMPRLCAAFIVSIHSSVVAFFGQMIARTRSERISAPPPGRLSRPSSLSRLRTSRMLLPVILAKFTISTGVKALTSTCGRAALTWRTTAR